MLTTVFALLVLAGGVLYFMTPEERTKASESALAAIKQAIREASEGSAPSDPFNDFLRARTGRLVVTPLLVTLNALAFTFMLVGPGAFDDPQTLVNWGGNFAPRTTNGEWWRVLTSTFVHGGMLHLLTTIAGLVPVGLILERAVGRIAFATVYLTAGILAGVINLWTTSPTSVGIGASGAIFGIYGLLLASAAWGIVSRPPVSVPLHTVKRIAAAAAIFVLYNVATGHMGAASELAGLSTGFVAGLVVARGVSREKPAARRAGLVMAAATLIAVVCAVPLHGIVDVRPEIARIAAIEARTAGAYDAAVVKFRKGWASGEELVELIDRTIIPELQGIRARVKALSGVPREQAPLVAAAEEYFHLREESWRRRAKGLLQFDMDMLREAEKTERAALEVFRRIQPSS